MNSPMRELFLRSMAVFEVFRTLGYTADQIFVVAGSGAWHVELRHHGKSFVVTVGPLPDTIDEVRARDAALELRKEYMKEEGGWFDDEVVRPYVNDVKKQAEELVYRMIEKGVFPR
jgi:hypothetical protein